MGNEGHKSFPKLNGPLSCLNPVIIDGLTRIGQNEDGGYVVPASILPEASALVSFGLGTDISFEEQMARQSPNLTIHVYDHTVNGRAFLRDFVRAFIRLCRLNGSFRELLTPVKRFLVYRRFFEPGSVRRTHFRERVYNRVELPNDATIDQVFARLPKTPNILLKMDIEGGEYRVIEDLLRYQERIDLMAMEFHGTESYRETFLKKVEAILKYYEVVHVHGNNFDGIAPDGLPAALEITFLSKRCATGTARRDRLPLAGLDYPNNPAAADYEISFV